MWSKTTHVYCRNVPLCRHRYLISRFKRPSIEWHVRLVPCEITRNVQAKVYMTIHARNERSLQSIHGCRSISWKTTRPLEHDWCMRGMHSRFDHLFFSCIKVLDNSQESPPRGRRIGSTMGVLFYCLNATAICNSEIRVQEGGQGFTTMSI